MSEDFMRKHYAEVKSKAGRGKAYLLSLIPLCKDANVDRVVAHYDGSGDSGAIEEDGVKAFSDGEEKELATLAIKSDQLMNACYDVLENVHPGWEINDGSYGDVVLYVNEGSVKIEHNRRYTDSEYTDTEV